MVNSKHTHTRLYIYIYKTSSRCCRSFRGIRDFADRVANRQQTHQSITPLALEDFLLDKDPVCEADVKLSLTKTQRKWLNIYKTRFAGAQVVDLTQNPAKRPRKGVGLMPTLTTSCNKMLHVPSFHMFTGMELALLHAMPVSGSAAEQLRTRKFKVNDVSKTTIVWSRGQLYAFYVHRTACCGINRSVSKAIIACCLLWVIYQPCLRETSCVGWGRDLVWAMTVRKK